MDSPPPPPPPTPRRRHPRPGCTSNERLDHDGGELVSVLGDYARRCTSPAGIVEPRRVDQRVEDLGAEPAGAEPEPTTLSRLNGAAEREGTIRVSVDAPPTRLGM